MNELASAFVRSLDDAALEELTDLLAPRLEARLASTGPAIDEWLDHKGAAAYLGLTPNALEKHASARTVPFEQAGPGCKRFYRRSQLDVWRASADARTPDSRPR